MVRRRIAPRLPVFHIGRPPRQTNTRPKMKRFTKASNAPTIRPSILSFCSQLPPSLRFEFSACQVGFTNRQEKLKQLREEFTLYTNIQDKYYKIPVEILKEELELKEKWFHIEAQCITAFRRIIALWLHKKYSKRQLNTEDPATLSEPIKPIYVFDGKLRGTYVFEATTLKKHIEGSLSYAEWLIPYPKIPSNPLTNISFTKAQLLKILDEMRSYRIGSWMFEAFRRLEFILPIFREIFMVPVKIRALEDMMRNPTHEITIELVTEFVQDEYESSELPFPNHIAIIKWAIEQKPEHPYIKEWFTLYHSYTSSIILYGSNIDKINDIELDIHNSALELFERHEEITELGRLRLATMTRRRLIPIQSIIVPAINVNFLLPLEDNEQDTT
jgi:hypothetical protein